MCCVRTCVCECGRTCTDRVTTGGARESEPFVFGAGGSSEAELLIRCGPTTAHAAGAHPRPPIVQNVLQKKYSVKYEITRVHIA